MSKIVISAEQNSRNYWPWFLAFIPFTAVLFGILMIVTAILHPDDLVVDDYYKDGMAINQRLSADELALEKKVSATLISISDDHLEIEIQNVNDSAVELKLFHVTDRSRDQIFVLIPETGSSYRVQHKGLAVLQRAGVWYIELAGTDENWRLKSRIQTPIDQFEISVYE